MWKFNQVMHFIITMELPHMHHIFNAKNSLRVLKALAHFTSEVDSQKFSLANFVTVSLFLKYFCLIQHDAMFGMTPSTEG